MNDQTIERQIQAKGKTAPRITPADIEANIAREVYFTASEAKLGAETLAAAAANGGVVARETVLDIEEGPLALLTFCVLVLKNGFTVSGESACASPENFDAEIGRNIARQNAVQKIWPLMGYQLRDMLHRRAVFDAQPRVGAGADRAVETKGYSDGSAFIGIAPVPEVSPDGAPALQPHQQRVVDEKRDLDERLAKLVAFFNTPIFAGLDEEERQRLEHQAAAMQEYSTILGERIAAFAPLA